MCGGRFDVGYEIAARDVDRLGKGEGHGLAGDGPLEVALVRHDALDMSAQARRQDDDFIARPDAAAQHGAGVAAKARASWLIHCTARRKGRPSRGRALTVSR